MPDIRVRSVRCGLRKTEIIVSAYNTVFYRIYRKKRIYRCLGNVGACAVALRVSHSCYDGALLRRRTQCNAGYAHNPYHKESENE